MKIEKHYSLREFAGLCRISSDAARRLLDKRQVAFRKIGSLIRIAESDLEAFMARTRTAAYGEAINSSGGSSKSSLAPVPKGLKRS
jgi:excisionase family DNA binding protein